MKERFTLAVNQLLAGRDAAIAAYELGMVKTLDTTELESQQQDGEVTAFSEKLWCGLLGYAMAYADGRLNFTYKNGSTFEG